MISIVLIYIIVFPVFFEESKLWKCCFCRVIGWLINTSVITLSLMPAFTGNRQSPHKHTGTQTGARKIYNKASNKLIDD